MLCGHRPLYRGNLRDGEWGVRWYGGRGLFYSPCDQRPILPLLFFSTLYPLLSTHHYPFPDTHLWGGCPSFVVG